MHQSRPILCKFVRRDTKSMLLMSKKLTKNIRVDPDGNPVKIFIGEDLTAMRARVCKKLRQDRVSYHTRDGKVFISSDDGNSYKVYNTAKEWEELDWPENTKVGLGIYPKD